METGTDGNLKLGGKLLLRLFVAMATVSVGSYFTSGAFGAPYYHPQPASSLYTTAFTGIDQGFATITSVETASSQPCTWASAGTCRTTLTPGNSGYAFEVRLNTSPSSTKTYTVTVNWDNGGTGASVQMCQFVVTVPSTARAGQYMNFQCDTGVASIASPASVQVAFR